MVSIKYDEFKVKYPDALLLFAHEGYHYAICEDAVIVQHIVTGGRGHISGLPVVRMEREQLEVNLPRLVRAGHRIAICDGFPMDTLGEFIGTEDVLVFIVGDENPTAYEAAYHKFELLGKLYDNRETDDVFFFIEHEGKHYTFSFHANLASGIINKRFKDVPLVDVRIDGENVRAVCLTGEQYEVVLPLFLSHGYRVIDADTDTDQLVDYSSTAKRRLHTKDRFTWQCYAQAQGEQDNINEGKFPNGQKYKEKDYKASEEQIDRCLEVLEAHNCFYPPNVVVARGLSADYLLEPLPVIETKPKPQKQLALW